MIERAHDRFGLWPERLAANAGYGDAPNLAWLVEDKGIAPHIPVFDKSARTDGTFERSAFTFDAQRDVEIAKREGHCRTRLTQLIMLSCLAPDIVTAIVEGCQPPSLTAHALLAIELPLGWRDQRTALGFC